MMTFGSLTTFATLRWALLAGLFLVGVVWSLRFGWYLPALESRGPHTLAGDYSLAIAAALLTAGVCRADARAQGRPMLPIFQHLLFFTWWLVWPAYLVWSRGWIGWLWIIVLVSSSTLILSAFMIMGTFLRVALR